MTRQHDRDPLPVALIEAWQRSRARWLLDGVTAVLITLGVSGLASANAAEDAACRDVTHLEDRYTVCSFSPDTHEVSLHLRGENGEPMGSLRALERDIGPFEMAMNAGMYRNDLSALGLYVEAGEEQERLITSDGRGNFHLLPNGVFHVSLGDDGTQRFGVTETRAFARSRPANLVHATQSGPMLVIDGALHPRFLPASNSLKVRNGVGVSADGRVHFAISRGVVRFHDFATLFRDVLETPNALFLDGTISAFRAGTRRQGGWRPIGPMVAVRPRESPTE